MTIRRLPEYGNIRFEGHDSANNKMTLGHVTDVLTRCTGSLQGNETPLLYFREEKVDIGSGVKVLKITDIATAKKGIWSRIKMLWYGYSLGTADNLRDRLKFMAIDLRNSCYQQIKFNSDPFAHDISAVSHFNNRNPIDLDNDEREMICNYLRTLQYKIKLLESRMNKTNERRSDNNKADFSIADNITSETLKGVLGKNEKMKEWSNLKERMDWRVFTRKTEASSCFHQFIRSFRHLDFNQWR